MAVINFGSLNIDLVFRVPHIVQGGETLACRSLARFAGGKGLNQSVALARAGAKVFHAGRVGGDGLFLVDLLAGEGVDVRHIVRDDGPSGQAIIQVDDAGQNAIVLLGGANQAVTAAQAQQTLAQFGPGDTLLLQNETAQVSALIELGRRQGLQVCFNPAPFGEEVLDYPLDKVDLLVLNESEAAGLTGRQDPQEMLDELGRMLPHCQLVLTLGAQGAWAQAAGAGPGARQHEPAQRVQPVDTTAAGDCFIGYLLAALLAGQPLPAALGRAGRAAAISVTRPGAMASIPRAAEVA